VILAELVEDDPASLDPEVPAVLAKTGGYAVYALLANRMADVTDEVRAERFALATGFILRAVADRARVLGRRGRRGRPQLEQEASVQNLVTMVAAGAGSLHQLGKVHTMPDGDHVMRAWRTHSYGRPTEVLKLDSVPIPDPEPGEVRVRVQAIPFNLNDLERITGGNMMVRPDLPYSPGMEVMGVVDACGDGSEVWHGRRVVAMPKGAHGGYAEYAICPVVSTFEMPDTIPLPGAAALYFPFHLAWLGLFDRADLQAGESVLIHAAAGGSGSAAIQLAKHRGARVFATAGTDEKVQLCRDLGADVAINYNESDFAEVVLTETGNRGVEVVFDNVGEAVMEPSMRCTAYNGRYLMMGFASNKVVADEPFIVPRRVMLGNFKLCGVLLAYAQPAMSEMLKTAMGWNFATEQLGEQIMRDIVALALAGTIKPVIGQTIGFEEIPVAIEAMANRETIGRTIVVL
jgi:NADPH:quinone reductase